MDEEDEPIALGDDSGSEESMEDQDSQESGSYEAEQDGGDGGAAALQVPQGLAGLLQNLDPGMMMDMISSLGNAGQALQMSPSWG